MKSSPLVVTAAGEPGEGDAVRLIAPGFLITALTVGALAQGGKRLVPAVCISILITAAVVTLPLLRRTTRVLIPSTVVIPLGLLALWGLLRGAGTNAPASGVGYVLVLLGALSVAVLVGHLADDERAWFARTLLLVAALVATTGWVGVILRLSPWGHLDAGIWRAATPMTYENAAAGLLVPLALVALGASVGAVGAQRRVYSLTAVVLLVGAGATLSRGGLLALAIGLLALAMILGRTAAVVISPLVGAGVGVVALLPSLPAAREPVPALAVAGLAAGLLVAVTSPRRASMLGGAGAVGIGAVAAVATDRWLPLAGARLSPSLHRAEQLRAAWHEWLGNPWIGVGPGQARLQWESIDGATLSARYVHNEYVQILLELGLIGFALLVLFVLALLRRTRVNAPTNGPGTLAAGAMAGVVAFLVHSTTDFLWHVPVVPLSAAALLALATTREEQR